MSFLDQSPSDSNDNSSDQDYSNSDTEDESTGSKLLETYAEEKNLCDKLDQECINKVGSKVLFGFNEDETSQHKWMADVEDALRLARLHKEPKNTPLPQSANIKYPLITTASYQFAARTYPELIQDGKIVKTEVAGQSSPLIDMIAYGVTTHMSHQLLGSDSDWEAGMDKLLTVLPNVGCVFKKTYYDTVAKKNCSDVCFYKDVIIRNDECVQSLNDLRRITHKLHVHPNDLVEGCRAGLYDETAVMEIMEYYSTNQHNPECTLLEQHNWIDLDEDSYEEPYIVTLHKQTNKVIRIYARYKKEDIDYNDKNKVQKINAIQYFTKYDFLTSPDGSFMGVGFGTLMLHMNETVNTILNQLIDAGTLANLQTGFIDSRLKVMGGQMAVDPGTWTRVKGVIGQQLKDGILPINYKEPSTVLYQLLGLILQASKELTSSTDAMQGMQNATNVPATSMLAMIEQGMKMFSAIQRRLYRSLKDEYQKIYRLNGLYLDEQDYMTVLGPEYQQLPNIYKTKAIKVIPVADPNMSSDAQRMAQSQAIMQMAVAPGALVNRYEAEKAMLQSIKVNNLEKLLPPQLANQPKAPDPKMIDIQAKHQTKMAEVQIKGKAQDLKEKEFVAKLSKIEAEITKMQAGSLKDVSQAQAISKGSDVDEFNSKLDAIKTQLSSVAQAHAQMTQAHQGAIGLQLQKQELDQQGQQNQVDNQQNQQDLDQTHQRESVNLQQQQDQIDNDQQQSGQNNQSNDNGMDQSSGNSGNA